MGFFLGRETSSSLGFDTFVHQHAEEEPENHDEYLCKTTKPLSLIYNCNNNNINNLLGVILVSTLEGATTQA